MTTLNRFFNLNINIVIFVYGVIFFLMGFGILLKNRQHSKFSLAKSLHWLALFGIIHAFADWGHLFIPLQKLYASEQTYIILKTIRIIINTISFMFLLQFGISLYVHTKKKWEYLKYFPLIIFVLWFVQLIFYKVFFNVINDPLLWVRVSDIWSRYIIAFPGALLSGYAIMLQKDEFLKYNYYKYTRVLTLAGVSLFIYGIASGIIVPEGPIMFAKLINAELFFTVTSLPIEIIRAFSGALLLISFLKIIQVFDKEYINILQQSEKEKAIFEERNRIAQDLHDGIIQSLYATNLQMEVVNHLIYKDPEQASRKLSFSLSKGNQIIKQIREYIGELKRVATTDVTLRERITEILSELNLREKMNVRLNYSFIDNGQLSVSRLYHLSLIIKEVLSNALKHSDAKNLLIDVNKSENKLMILIKDDGKGFIVEEQLDDSQAGNKLGLANIRERAYKINSYVYVESKKNKGTSLSIEIPLEGDCHKIINS